MRRIKQWLGFKEKVNNLDLLYIHPHLMLILGFVNVFCYEQEIKFEITSIIRTVEEDKKLGATSSTHSTGRAFDFSIKESHGWTYEKIQLLIDEINKRFNYIGAISASNGLHNPIVIHDNGNGRHAHIQVRGGLKSAIQDGGI